MSLNNFILGKELGKGAYGSVRIVTRKEDKKIYAMKSVNISKLDDKEKESALNEVRILASLNHPNIIGYKEAFYDNPSKSLNIIMEYADDGDIASKIKDNVKRRLRFDESQIWEWIIQILQGLKYLHSNKIMHRDLKCANLFLMKTGQIKIGDLNVSKLAKNNMARTQTGTPFYLAPEIWKDLPYDYKCDIWSIGCIIYELCTSHPPFRGTSLKELSNNVLTGYYLPIEGFSNDMKELVAKMLVVDPVKRASIDTLINCDIIQRRIKAANKNIISNEIKNPKKAKFIKTIKLPKNMNEINLALPQNKYNPRETMMENDPYEKTKNKYMEETLKQNNQQNSSRDTKPEPVVYNRRNNAPQNNNRKKLEIIIEKKPQNKYGYLNKYDNNMRLKNDNVYINRSPINSNVKNRPTSQQYSNNYNRFNYINKYNISPSNKVDFSKGNKKARYQNIFGDEPKSNINSNRPTTQQNEQKPTAKYNNRKNNNRQNEYQKGWFKKNYPDFKYNQPKRAANCKVNYGKINYNDYCKNNKIDKGKNYHYYRANGYYNYRNAMNAYNGRQNQVQVNVNRFGFNAKSPKNNVYKVNQFGNNNGPNIVNHRK